MGSHDKKVQEFNWRPFQAKGAIIHVTHPSYASDPMENLRRAVALYNRGVFRMEGIITHTFKLDDIQKAFENLEGPPADYNKGVVTP